MSNIVSEVSIVFPADDEIIKDKKKHHGCLSIIREFCLNTSAHGLSGIARSESLHNRVYWSIALISFTAFMIYLIIQAILAYFDYPTQINLSIDPEWPQYFPAFSFCNVGGIRLDRLIGPFLNYTNALNLTNTNDTTTLFPAQLLAIGNFLGDTLDRNESMEPFFYSLSSMLYSCSFNSVPCSEADFIPFITSTYGLCYTFNAKLINGSDDCVRYGNKYGGPGKLELGLYVHSHQYVPYLVDSVGAVGLIHDNRQVPVLDLAGYNLIPGQKHILNYQKKTSLLLPSPYTPCTDKIFPRIQTILDNYPGTDYGYSHDLCVRLSIQIYTYKQCGCVDPSFWDIRSIVLPGTNHVFRASLCNTTDPCFKRAADAYMNLSSYSRKSELICPHECSITNFIVKKSSLSTPVEWQMSSIKTFVEKSSVPLPSDWSTAWREYIHANYLAVSVVREAHVVEKNIQKAAISVTDVLSNIGGQTGLWIGISLLSVMELIEMLYRLVRYQCHVIRSAIPKKLQMMHLTT